MFGEVPFHFCMNQLLFLAEDQVYGLQFECLQLTLGGYLSLSILPSTHIIIPILILVQPRKTHPNITERLLMGRKESNQRKQKSLLVYQCDFQQCGLCDQQRLRPACAYAQSDQSLG